MKKGFTLSEILLVVTILAILVVFALLNFQKQTVRGYDVKRKSDLATLKVVFEDYYNDHDCYPTKAIWDAYNCTTKANGEFLAPYLNGKPIPCDPQTNERYLYIEGITDACSGYKLFAALGITVDIDITAAGCDPDPFKGCGYEPTTHNYGISMGEAVANPDFDFDAPIPTSIPTPPSGYWVCTPFELNCQGKSASCIQQLVDRGCVTWENGTACSASCLLRQNICQDSALCQ
jgi:prepilin-type N-terminal cleavage/methylation domain-containing protein